MIDPDAPVRPTEQPDELRERAKLWMQHNPYLLTAGAGPAYGAFTSVWPIVADLEAALAAAQQEIQQLKADYWLHEAEFQGTRAFANEQYRRLETIAAETREACAQIAEQHSCYHKLCDGNCRVKIAAAIRQAGTEETKRLSFDEWLRARVEEDENPAGVQKLRNILKEAFEAGRK